LIKVAYNRNTAYVEIIKAHTRKSQTLITVYTYYSTSYTNRVWTRLLYQSRYKYHDRDWHTQSQSGDRIS